MTVDIREIEYSAWTASKVSSKHRLTIDEVFDAIENHASAVWDHHAEYGRRLLVRGRTHLGRELRIVLYPVDEEQGTFRLGTAF